MSARPAQKRENIMSLQPESSNREAKVHGEHVIHLAKQLADGARAGVLATVDRAGVPHLRWMATVSLVEFPHLYALTSPSSRKIRHIDDNPRVSWMFTNESSSLVINLSGMATILTERADINRIWRMIDNKAHAYFLNLDPDAGGVAVIDTLIEDIECVIPRYDLHYPAAGKASLA
jgi:general stress protein 26